LNNRRWKTALAKATRENMKSVLELEI
jgi:hypothetical protein